MIATVLVAFKAFKGQPKAPAAPTPQADHAPAPAPQFEIVKPRPVEELLKVLLGVIRKRMPTEDAEEVVAEVLAREIYRGCGSK